jgi:hypothetical protein
MSILTATTDRIAAWLGYVKAKPEDVVRFESREGIYAYNQLAYDGTLYRPQNSGGMLEGILKTSIGSDFCDVNKNRIQPFFLPVQEIVEAYQYVLPGVFGDGVTIADAFDGKPIDPRLKDPIGRIWRASNLDTEKAKILRWGPNFGTVGLRVVARQKAGDRPARVSIVADHPSHLFNFEEDDEGNIVAVCLKYTKTINNTDDGGTLADPVWQTVEVVEEITRDDFSLTFDGVQQLEDDARRNTLGFAPYVVQRHKDNGTPYGDHAYKGSEDTMHRINWRLSRQDKSIDRHQFPKWFAAAGGASPTTDVRMGEDDMTYVQTMEGTPPPILQAIVAQVDQKSAMDFVGRLYAMLRKRQPELALNDSELLANTSGEALEQALEPVKKKIADARPGYVHGFTRALQMAVSAGKTVGAWPIGGDEDYRAGRLNFAFGPMPLLPLTTAQRQQQAAADAAPDAARLDLATKAKALGLPQKEQWRKAGYTETQIAALLQERSDQPVLDTEDDGVGGNVASEGAA